MFFLKSRPTVTSPNWLAEESGLDQTEIAAWDRQIADIDEAWDWFTGEALNEEDMQAPAVDGKRPLIYPLQINLIHTGLRLLSFALAGEVSDSSDPLVQTVIEPRLSTDEARALAHTIEQVLKDVEYQNNTRGQDTDMFASIQGLGGMVLKVREEPISEQRPLGICWEYFDPREFWAHWEGTEYTWLTEAWIRQTISSGAAKALGVDLKGQTGTYLEYWNREKYWIKIDGKPAVDAQGPIDRSHPYGFVPFQYVPRLRANGFWGINPVPEVIGLVREYNSRMADTGDATHMSVFDRLAMRNVRTGYPSEVTLKDGTQVLNLGRAVSGSDPQPDLFRPGGPKLPEGSSDFTEQLLHLARYGLDTPDVAYGEDQGSQRSGATLHSRMWALVADIRAQRTFWTLGRNARAAMTLKILSLRKLAGITKEHLGHRMSQVWAEPLPLDRASLVDELVRRKQEHLGSLESILTKFGDSPDVQAEIEKIKADIIWEIEQDAKLIAAKTPSKGLSAGTQKV